MTSDAVETAAQLIHQRHRAGTANACGECREAARQVAEVLDVERLRADVAMYRDWCARLPTYEHECACGQRFSLRSIPALVDQLAELERLRGIEQQARALSLRNDRLYSLFVDATGYEPNLELGDDQ